MGENKVIRITNYFLVGIFGGGGLAAVIGLLFLGVERSVPLESEGPKVVEKLEISPDSASGPTDSDGDGMPDEWESRYGLDPNDDSDASSDFDRDALTALQEFQHGTSPVGDWNEEAVPDRNLIVAESSARIYQAFSASGHILTSGNSANSSENPRTRSAFWTPGGDYEEIAADFDAHIFAYDVNDAGVVVGGFTKDGESKLRPFSWTSGGPFVELEVPSGMDGFCLAYRINNRGEMLLQSHEESQFVSLVIDSNGSPIPGTELEGGAENPENSRLVDLNDFGGLLGVYTSALDGLPKVLLKFPGSPDFYTQLDAAYPELFGRGFSTTFFNAKMNNYGEFGNDFDLRGVTSAPNGFFFYDGEYHSLRKSGDGDMYLLGLNDVPQILFKAMVDGEADYRLSSGGQVISIDLMGLADRPGYETTIVALNESGEILGYRKGEGNSRHEVFRLRADLDSDDDGLSNDWETYYGLNPNDGSDGLVDSDDDGLNNLAEYRLKRNPMIDEGPYVVDGNVPDMRAGIDTDGDGMPNIWEITYGLNWDDPSDAHLDLDRDGYTNLQEFFLGTTPAGAPVYEPIAVDLEGGQSPRSLHLTDEGSVLGIAINHSNEWQGFELTAGGEEKWFEASDGNATTSVYTSSNQLVGGGEKWATESYDQPVVWNRETLHATRLNLPFPLDRGEVVSLGHNGYGGAVVFTRPHSKSKYEVCLMNGSSMKELAIPGSLGLVNKGSITMHRSGAGIACVKFSGWKYDIVTWDEGAVWDGATRRFTAGRYQVPLVSKDGPPIYAWVKGRSNHSKVCIFDEEGALEEISLPTATDYRLKHVSHRGEIYGDVTLVPSDESVRRSKPFVIRKSSEGAWQFEILPSGLGESVSLKAANGTSESIGSINYNSKSSPVLWRGMKTRFNLNDQLAKVGLDFQIDAVSGINNAGEILAVAFDGEMSRPHLLRPVSDTDGDGAPDAWEIRYSFDPFDASDGELDPDRDGLSNSEEHRHRTNPLKSDSDDDTMKDGWEVAWGLDPLEAADAYSDPDEDLVQNRFEHALGTAPTGIYRLEEKQIGGIDPNTGFQLVATHVDQDASFSVVTATISGVQGTYLVGHDPGDPTDMIPPLAPGKRVTVRTIGRTGTLYGYATDADNKSRCFCYRMGDPELTVFDIPSHPENPYVYLYDVSSDERSILVRRRTPGNTFTTDIFSPVLGEEFLYHFREELPADAHNGSHTLTVTSESVQENGTLGALDYYFSPTVCENSLFALGVQQNYHYMSGESDDVLARRLAPDTF